VYDIDTECRSVKFSEIYIAKIQQEIKISLEFEHVIEVLGQPAHRRRGPPNPCRMIDLLRRNGGLQVRQFEFCIFYD
jgi:hypothetical protein